jgi:hypothetical protein
MAKEMRVYIIDTSRMSDEDLFGNPVYTSDNESFMDMAETFGDVYSLKGFEEAVSLRSMDLSNCYLRFIKI